MLVISETEVSQLFDMDEAFRAVREAAIAHVSGKTVSPPRTAVTTAGGGEFLVMPGATGTSFATKTWYSLSHGRGDIPSMSAVILLVDPELGDEVLIGGGLVTDLRTGAMTGLAAQRLAPASARKLGVVGAGVQARTQILALLHALGDIREVSIYSRSPERRTRFCEAVTAEIANTPSIADAVTVSWVADPAQACRGSDVIVAATTSSTPVIRDEWVGDEALVCSVGSHAPDQAELEVDTVGRASVVAVDTVRGAVDGAGDIANAIAAGRVQRGDVVELGHLVRDLDLGAPPGPKVFKSVGFAAADVVAAHVIARAAVDRGMGTHVELR